MAGFKNDIFYADYAGVIHLNCHNIGAGGVNKGNDSLDYKSAAGGTHHSNISMKRRRQRAKRFLRAEGDLSYLQYNP